VLAVDWFNGCRTPLMDARVSGGFVGLTLGTRPEQLYRATMEATAYGVRWICDTLRDAGVPVQRFVASGGLPAKSPLLMQIYADVLGQPIRLTATDQPVALGAAMLGCAAGAPERDIGSIIRAMSCDQDCSMIQPNAEARAAYDAGYGMYRSLCRRDGTLANVMRQLRSNAD
jgi:L-ribulokinase